MGFQTTFLTANYIGPQGDLATMADGTTKMQQNIEKLQADVEALQSLTSQMRLDINENTKKLENTFSAPHHPTWVPHHPTLGSHYPTLENPHYPTLENPHYPTPLPPAPTPGAPMKRKVPVYEDANGENHHNRSIMTNSCVAPGAAIE